MKRFNLVLPEHDYGRVEDLAGRRGTTATALIRAFIRLGLALTHGTVERILVKYDDQPEPVEIKLLF